MSGYITSGGGRGNPEYPPTPPPCLGSFVVVHRIEFPPGLVEGIFGRLDALLASQVEQSALIVQCHEVEVAKLDQILAEVVEVHPHAKRVVFDTTYEGVEQKDVSHMIIQVKKQFTASVKFLDDDGNVAEVQGLPEWKNDNTAILAMKVAGDGLSATVAAIGGVGSGQISVVADADLGEGVEEIIGILDVQVKGGKATVVQIDTGPVTDMNVVDNTLPLDQPVIDNTLPGDLEHPDRELPGDQPVVNPGDVPYVDPRKAAKSK